MGPLYPYYSHTTPIAKDMGMVMEIVWASLPYGCPLIGSPSGITLEMLIRQAASFRGLSGDLKLQLVPGVSKSCYP